MNKRVYSILGYMILSLITWSVFNYKLNVESIISSSSAKTLAAYFPYIGLSIVAFLGVKLNQTRIFFSSLLILTFYQLSVFESFDNFLELAPLTFFKSMLFSIPLCLTAWFMCKESSLSGNKSLVRMFIGLSPLITVLIIGINEPDLFKLLVEFNYLTSIDSYIATFCVLVLSFLFMNDKKIRDYHLSSIFSLIPIGLFSYYQILQVKTITSAPLLMALCFGISSLMMLYSLFSMYWQRVYLDEMTNLPNRRALDERVNALGGNYSIAMIDVDHFKKFNDTYGHDQGDDVLKLVARTLESVLGNKVYRYGGEEFAAVFATNTLEESTELVDKARVKLSQRKFTVRVSTLSNKRSKKNRGSGGGKKVSVTISAGISNVSKVADSPSKVIKIADTALYKAKEKGRNCVVSAAA